MKTNQVMIRPMGVFKVEQRTKDGMFNATALIRQWNESMGEKKEVTKFFELENTKAFISALMEEEKLNTQDSAYLKTRGKKGGTWMHPILFVKFAMWINPRFEVQVIKFVYDQMIAYRNDAGDAYKELAKSVSTIVESSFMPTAMKQIATGINYIIFGGHETLIRNQHGNEAKMRELFSFERKVADLISEGFLKNQDEVMKYLRMMWKKKHTPKLFTE